MPPSMRMVSAVAKPAGSVTGDLDDRRSGGGLVDQALVLCEGGDKCMHSEVVDGSGDAPAGLMDQGDGVVAEERIRSAGKADVVLDVAGGLRQVHPLQVDDAVEQEPASRGKPGAPQLS